jgi:MFS family permease
MNYTTAKATDTAQSVRRAFAVAWACCTVFYFLEYAVRSAPGVMIPELQALFGVSALGVSAILGIYYYTYASLSLVAGALLDHYGAKVALPAGALVLSAGCFLFALPLSIAGDLGRLLQGGGSAFAFVGAVYLAAHGLSAQRLATAIGLTQCVGMLGGTAGQLGVGPLIHGALNTQGFWLLAGILVAAVAVSLFLVTPRQATPAKTTPESKTTSLAAMLQTYRVVFSNPQSYLCGLIAGLLFAPTTILDMVWGVRYLEQDNLFPYRTAVFAASMVPLGWVVGCPAFGWLTDYLGRRKPALLAGMVLMLLCILQLTFAYGLLPTWVTLFIWGFASGAAMIPYSIIKEVNPDRVKGSATGAMNFLTFSVTAVLGPVFAHTFGKTLSTSVDHAAHLRHTFFFWILVVAAAMAVTLALKETGTAARVPPIGGVEPETHPGT